ncbi:SHOCT domain-containing protein [Halobacteria archaeon AArc-m2/3/4]|uniref:SHOCT domain-containing protein n=1 Tax=Natronoglomus mannanivorans TaxID=2979990 RepID=A0ABT2QFF7_9EURY|nr:SHOCT domain-containing protein [Halobacteria archaeon AArc-m2/3/4]
MGRLDRTSMLGLILSLSLGVCTLFLVAHEFFFGPFFEFLAMTSLILGWFIVAPTYYFLTRPADTETETGAAATVDPGHATSAETTTPTDPLETLRRRYAAGELSEAEFERKLERLLETEGRSLDDSGVESGSNSIADDHVQNELDRELEREREREREREYESD